MDIFKQVMKNAYIDNILTKPLAAIPEIIYIQHHERTPSYIPQPAASTA